MSDYYIGLMSGTSMDAVDVVIVDLEDNQCKLLKHYSHEIPVQVKKTLASLIEPAADEISRMMQMDVALGQLFAEAINQLLTQCELNRSDIKAIGSHGQTIRHYPAAQHPATLQIGDANIIAELTGITTVADFRRRDIAAGGQGAPLVPAFHNIIFHDSNLDQVILNLGGIANITLLTSNDNTVTGYDTGPANCLLDSWVHQHLKLNYDRDGEWAASGHVHPGLLERMLNDHYFALPAPKSTGREYFNLGWLNEILKSFPGLAPHDVQATLLELTARTISDAIEHSLPSATQVLVCGGGVHNKQLMLRLNELLVGQHITSTNSVGIDPDWIEAMAFAWLAKQTLSGKTGNIPSVTGAQHPVILGAIYPAN